MNLFPLFLISCSGFICACFPGAGIPRREAVELQERCLFFLVEKLKVEDNNALNAKLSTMENYGWGDIGATADVSCGDDMQCDNIFGINPFYIENVLLEGSPGVRKTSLIVSLGNYSGHKVVHINLSEQTAIMDLLGSDLPIESDEGMKFAWSDGILLQAIKEGCWVLLDELNLAPQFVLEALLQTFLYQLLTALFLMLLPFFLCLMLI